MADTVDQTPADVERTDSLRYMRTVIPHSAPLLGLVTFVTAIVVELISASGPLLDKPFNIGVETVAGVALGTYILPGLLVAALLTVALLVRRRSHAGTPLSGPLVFGAVLLLGLIRILLQILGGDARFVTGLFAAALAVAVLLLVVAFAAARSATLTALGLTAGGVLAAAISLTLGTWDAIWRSGASGWVPMALLVLLAAWCAWGSRNEPGLAPPRRLWVLGPFLAMLVMIIANPAYLASQLGLPLSVVGIAQVLSLVATAILLLQTMPRRHAVQPTHSSAQSTESVAPQGRIPSMTWLHAGLLVVLFTVVLFPIPAPGAAAPVLLAVTFFAIIVLVPALTAAALTRAWTAPVRERPTTRATALLAGTGVLVGLGVILPLLVYQLDYDVPLPVPNATVPLLTILLVAVAGVTRPGTTKLTPDEDDPTSTSPSHIPPSHNRDYVLTAGLVFSIGLVGLIGAGLNTLPGQSTVTEPAADEVLLLDWNLHFGVTQDPGMGLDQMAQVINDSGAQIVTLQEVSRGWVMGGRADMATYLARATEKNMVLAPAADRQFTNMILVDPALGPIEDVVRTRLPYGDGPQWRSAVTATIEIPGLDEGLTVTSTHLQHREENTPTRLEQLDVLLATDLASGPAILAGDLNAEPGWPEIDRITDLGYTSAQDTAGDETTLTFPSWEPEIRIDWIWGQQVSFEDFQVLSTTPSDHRALQTMVRLNDEAAVVEEEQ